MSVPNYGFLNEDITLASFVFWGPILSSALNCDNFRTFGFFLILVDFFSSSSGTYLATFQHFSCIQRTKYRKGFLHQILCTHLTEETLKKYWTRFTLKMFCPKGGLILKTVATFVQKVGLIWLQGDFLL